MPIRGLDEKKTMNKFTDKVHTKVCDYGPPFMNGGESNGEYNLPFNAIQYDTTQTNGKTFVSPPLIASSSEMAPPVITFSLE